MIEVAEKKMVFRSPSIRTSDRSLEASRLGVHEGEHRQWAAPPAPWYRHTDPRLRTGSATAIDATLRPATTR